MSKLQNFATATNSSLLSANQLTKTKGGTGSFIIVEIVDDIKPVIVVPPGKKG
jgi:hypothetical protein